MATLESISAITDRAPVSSKLSCSKTVSFILTPEVNTHITEPFEFAGWNWIFCVEKPKNKDYFGGWLFNCADAMQSPYKVQDIGLTISSKNGTDITTMYSNWIIACDNTIGYGNINAARWVFKPTRVDFTITITSNERFTLKEALDRELFKQIPKLSETGYDSFVNQSIPYFINNRGKLEGVKIGLMIKLNSMRSSVTKMMEGYTDPDELALMNSYKQDITDKIKKLDQLMSMNIDDEKTKEMGQTEYDTKMTKYQAEFEQYCNDLKVTQCLVGMLSSPFKTEMDKKIGFLEKCIVDAKNSAVVLTKEYELLEISSEKYEMLISK
jgi:hypothetical protein